MVGQTGTFINGSGFIHICMNRDWQPDWPVKQIGIIITGLNCFMTILNQLKLYFYQHCPFLHSRLFPTHPRRTPPLSHSHLPVCLDKKYFRSLVVPSRSVTDG